MVKLKHTWKHRSEVCQVMTGVSSFPEFLKSLRKIADKMFVFVDDKGVKRGELKRDKFVGDGFEAFVEFLLLVTFLDNRFYVDGYTPNMGADNGIDGFGVDTRDKREVDVQAKCRYEHVVHTAKDLDSSVAESYISRLDRARNGEKVDFVNVRLLVITAAKGLHRYTKDVKYRGFVECYAYDDLCKLTNNPRFWEEFRAALNDESETKLLSEPAKELLLT